MSAATIDSRPPVAAPPAGAGRTTWWAGGRERLELGGLLVVSAVLYLWNLGASGYANDFYAAAVQAGTQSWKAFFFGSFDSSNFITVDKPPASLWPMELAGRIFGFGSWSMLVPQAVEGVLTVWLLYATIKRWYGHRAGLLAGGLLAVTPVAVLMFRFNNPDALMVLLIVLAAYCATRALEAASTRWLLLAGLVMGFSFLAKGLQPFTVLPALAIAYLVAAPTTWRRRLLQLLGAGVAIVVGAGWWVLAVDLTPAADRPYIGGSGNNTALGLAFGYNGLDRLDAGGNGPGGGFDGATGVGRLFNDLNGGQIAWLLPTALLALVALLVITRRAQLSDRTRAAAILWGGWLVVTGAVLSYATGIIHTYYTIELAPAIAALVAIGATVLWRARASVAARVALALGVLVSGIWTFRLLDRAPSFDPWVRWVVLAAAVVAALVLLVRSVAARRGAAAVTLGAALVAAAGGSAAYAVDTVRTPHTGSTPSAGPSTGNGFGGGRGGFGGRRFGGGFGGADGSRSADGFGGTDGSRLGGAPGTTNGTPPGGFGGGTPGASGTGSSGSGAAPGGFGAGPGGSGGTDSGAPGSPGGGTARRGGFGGGGGFGGARTVSSQVSALLKASTTRWAAATIGSQEAAPLELATGRAVMAIGGFSGSDAAPTLAQFVAYVAKGEIHYFIGGGGFGGGRGGPGGGRGTGSAITQWVESHYTATTVGGTTVYDLTKATS